MWLQAAAAILLVGQVACAQEAPGDDAALRSAVADALPAWWEVVSFEVTERAEVEAPTDEPETDSPTGKIPRMVVGTEAGGKPTSAANDGAALRFSAIIELSQPIYEPLYSLDGTAIVRPLMEAGEQLELSGYTLSGDEMVFADPGIIHLNQEGLGDLGRPLDAFGADALIDGSDEAEAFLAAREDARAEGMMNKVVGDEGDDL